MKWNSLKAKLLSDDEIESLKITKFEIKYLFGFYFASILFYFQWSDKYVPNNLRFKCSDDRSTTLGKFQIIYGMCKICLGNFINIWYWIYVEKYCRVFWKILHLSDNHKSWHESREFIRRRYSIKNDFWISYFDKKVYFKLRFPKTCGMP